MNIAQLTRDELRALLQRAGLPQFRAQQIFQWIHQKRVTQFGDMSNISKSLRNHLSVIYEITWPTVRGRVRSADETEKITFVLNDDSVVEAVIIPEQKRVTLCVSSQAGCPLNCAFCKTGFLGFHRNLTVDEIIGQVYEAQRIVESSGRLISNIVYMGMGEPLLNTDAVIASIHILTDDFGQSFSNRKITVSTAGIADQLERLGRETGVNLAVSLHAADNELRNRLMPINKTFPLEVLVEAVKRYPAHKRKKTVLEYIMLRGVNDSAADAKKLAKLAHTMNAKVNLIPFNSFDGTQFEATPYNDVLAFQNILIDRRVTALIRTARGDDSSAACGQLGVIARNNQP